MNFNAVPTTCTATMLTGWSLSLDVNNKDEKISKRALLKSVNNLISLGFKEDFALIFAITTENQIKSFNLNEFMPKIGFEKSFIGSKSFNKTTQRHQETGQLTMWCTSPSIYKECITNYKKELEEVLNKIDPPKKPDPERQKFPDLTMFALRKAKIIQDNSAVSNNMNSVLLVSPEIAENFIMVKFGFNISNFSKRGNKWVDLSIQSLKNYHQNWKKELV